MKKYIFLIFLITTIVSCTVNDEEFSDVDVAPNTKSFVFKQTQRRSFSEALYIAQHVGQSFQSRSARLINDYKTISLDKTQYIVKESVARSLNSEDTLMYVFNYEDNKGFAVVSANRSTEALIAVAESGNYDNNTETQNPAFGLYMDLAKNYVANRVRPLPDDGSIDVQILKDTIKVMHIEPRVEVQWGQTGCESTYTPNGYAGCTNTAIAQICSYFNHPTQISLTYVGANKNVQILNWNVIKQHKIQHSHATCTATNEAHEAIAQLHRQLGHLNNSEYGTETWTYNRYLLNTFNQLGFKTSSLYDFKLSSVSLSLQSGNIVFMGGSFDRMNSSTGSTETSGHHWIADGYASYTVNEHEYTKPSNNPVWEYVDTYKTNYQYLHLNWGWDGYCNGYFSVGVFDTQRGIYDNIGSNFDNNLDYNFYDTYCINVSL